MVTRKHVPLRRLTKQKIDNAIALLVASLEGLDVDETEAEWARHYLGAYLDYERAQNGPMMDGIPEVDFDGKG